jgi:acyl-coenzyme A synthetase/AMP-(fatty) acid ligase
VTDFTVPAFAEAQTAAIAFTSGSTGRPAPHGKTWGALARGAAAEAMRFGLHLPGKATLVGTVPPQHMYGLESTVLMALRNGLALHAGRPFYPSDVATALKQIPGERVLVTTPVHLRALLQEEVELPPMRLIVCATASLSPELAARAEKRYGVPLHEVYGFTEAGMVATRRSVQGPEWRCLRDVRVRARHDAAWVAGGHVENEVPFSDLIEPRGEDAFVLRGRSADQINIAGKRTSLGYLNHQLNGVTRLMAFVVAPDISREALLRALRARIDAAFLPRPLYLVDALPRNATGKLPREELLQYARACSAKAVPEDTI